MNEFPIHRNYPTWYVSDVRITLSTLISSCPSGFAPGQAVGRQAQGTGVSLTSPTSSSLMGKHTLIPCNSAPWAWDDVSNSQQGLLLLNCFYGQGSKRMKTTFPTQLSQPPISVPGTPQLCFKTMTFDFTSKHSSCRNTTSYLDIQKQGFQAGWLAGSLSLSLWLAGAGSLSLSLDLNF